MVIAVETKSLVKDAVGWEVRRGDEYIGYINGCENVYTLEDAEGYEQFTGTLDECKDTALRFTWWEREEEDASTI